MSQSIDNLHHIITTNRTMFKAGTVMTEEEFCKVAGIKYRQRFRKQKEMLQYQMSKMQMYTALNKLLRKRGLYIRSSDYYSTFELIPKMEVPSKVTAYQKSSSICHRNSIELSTGSKKYKSRWSKLSKQELSSL